MNRRVVIFGTWHHFPTGLRPGPDHHHHIGFEHHLRDFDRLIRGAAEKHAVAVIVEELGDDYLPDVGGASHLSKLARSLDLPYKNTDLTAVERATVARELGLRNWAEDKTPDWWRLQGAREARWLRDLSDLETWPVLIVCGSTHSERFRALAASNNLDPIVEVARWNPPARESN